MRWSERYGPAPKAAGSFDRTVALERTLALVPQLRERFGITRIADITHLDRIGIPVMSAIVPDSPDVISVYNGKGATRESALAGAVMEAVERQVAAAPRLPAYSRPAKDVLTALDPAGFWPLPRAHDVHCVAGVDLLSGNSIDVPLALAQCPWPGEPVIFGWSSNGLAAGNTFAEAVYHAVAELIERHLWALGSALGSLRPRSAVSRFAGGLVSLPGFIDDPVAPEIEFPTGFATVDDLAERIHRAGLTLHVRVIDIEPFPPAVVATTAGERGGESVCHSGVGCSLSPEHATIRALTEAAQARAADFLGAREDLFHHDAPEVASYGVRRSYGVPSGRWYFDAPTEMRTLNSFPDRSSRDVAHDVDAMIAALKRANAGPIAIVDLSPADVPLHVVRAVAPRLESPASGAYFGPTVSAILDPIAPSRSTRKAS